MKLGRPRSLRARLTAWYIAVFGSILVAYGALTITVYFFQLREQLDDHAVQQLELVEGMLRRRPDGSVYLPRESHDHPYAATDQETLIEVRSEDGTVLFHNESTGDPPFATPPGPGEGSGEHTHQSLRLRNGRRVRVASLWHDIDGKRALIRVALSEEQMWQGFFQRTAGLAIALPFALGLAAMAGNVLARRVLSPLDEMARRASEINAEQLNARLDAGNPNDELGRLATAFNETLARLEGSFDQLRRFTSDAAHELRTPLTAIRSVGEVALRGPADAEQSREVISSMLEETVRLGRLVEDLLTVARADSGQSQVRPTVIPLLSFSQEAADFLSVLAEEKGQTISVDGDPGLRVEADRAILRQVVINLLDNAIKYSPPGGAIAIRVRPKGPGTHAIEVVDSGPGIPLEHRARIFDRFYRVDEGRARAAGGSGLGLAIARWGAEVHGGRLEVHSDGVSGSTFRVLLPVSVNSTPKT
jgi:heavy metal sensor kinase